MELDSATPTGKRSRAKAKTPVSEAQTAAPTRARKSKKAPPAPQTEAQAQPDIQITSVTAVTTPDGEVMATMVATAAYYLAERRNFEPGHELEDWLEAERQIRQLYG